MVRSEEIHRLKFQIEHNRMTNRDLYKQLREELKQTELNRVSSKHAFDNFKQDCCTYFNEKIEQIKEEEDDDEILKDSEITESIID